MVHVGEIIMKTIQDIALFTAFLLLFGTALVANVSDGTLVSHRANWLTQAMR